MSIEDLKSRIDIIELARDLGIGVNGNSKALCPFHNDKTPSLQFSKVKQICTCFSSSCNAGTMDVISLTAKKLNMSTHKALKYLRAYLGEEIKKVVRPKPLPQHSDYDLVYGQLESSFLSSSTARAYVRSRGLKHKKVSMGYNSFRQSQYSFLRGCLCFALRDRENKVVGLYGRSLSSNTKSSKHFYTSWSQWVVPSLPKARHEKSLSWQNVFWMQLRSWEWTQITKEYEVLSCYGTEGRVEQIEAIIEAKDLVELIIFFDGDKGGREGGEIVASKIAQQRKDIKIKIVATPDGEDINSLVLGHEENILQHLIEAASVYTSAAQAKRKPIEKSRKPAAQAVAKKEKGLNSKNMNNMIYVGRAAIYYIKGGMRKDLDSLKVSLVIEHRQTKRKSRQKVDLYEDRQVEKLALQAAGKLQLSAEAIEEEIGKLTDLLEAYREQTRRERIRIKSF